MSNNLGTFLDEWLGTVMPAVWPEVTVPSGASASNFFTSIQAARQNVIEWFVSNPSQSVYTVAVVGTQTIDPDWTMDTAFYRMPLAVFYLARPTATVDQFYIHAKLQALNDYLASHAFNTFQVIEFGTIDTSETAPVNQSVWVDTDSGIQGGYLFFNPGILVSFAT